VLLKDDGVNATNLEITNLKANDGTSAGSIADSTGVVTLASSVLTTADINGGTIDGTTLGATTPSSVAATTGSFSSTLGVTGAATFSSTVAGAFNGTLGATTPASVAATTLSTTGAATFGGNVAIGLASTNTWSTGYAIEIGTEQAAIWGAGDQIDITGNAYFNSGWKAAATKSGASKYEQALGTHNFAVSGAVTADSAITFKSALNIAPNGDISFYEDTGTTAKLFWDASAESLGIGTSSPAETLHVAGAIATTAGISGHGANRATFSQEGAGGAFIQSYGANTLTMGAFVFRQASSDFSLNATPLTISATGDATFSGTVNGLTLAPSASGNRWGVTAEVASNGVMEIGRYIDFHSTDGDTSDYGARLDYDGTNIVSTNAFSMASGIYLGGTVAANLLDDYEEGTWTPTHSGMNAVGAVTVSGTYTKVGRKVHITGKISAVTSLAPVYDGGSRFQSLPFTGASCVANWCVANAVTVADSTFCDGTTNIYAPSVSVGAGVDLIMNMTLEV
jgi:hypothetical protein